MSARGMVVPAGSGARQFHVTRVPEGYQPLVVWTTGERGRPATCPDCASPRWIVAWSSLPKVARRWHRQRFQYHKDFAICEKCAGEFIE